HLPSQIALLFAGRTPLQRSVTQLALDASPPRPPAPSLPKLTRIEWFVCLVAGMGFAFDLYENLMLPLIVRPALADPAGLNPAPPPFILGVGLLFYIPTVTAGVFGLLGGYLTDLFGRKRILVASILLYSCSAAAASLSSTPTQLLFFRCLT